MATGSVRTENFSHLPLSKLPARCQKCLTAVHNGKGLSNASPSPGHISSKHQCPIAISNWLCTQHKGYHLMCLYLGHHSQWHRNAHLTPVEKGLKSLLLMKHFRKSIKVNLYNGKVKGDQRLQSQLVRRCYNRTGSKKCIQILDEPVSAPSSPKQPRRGWNIVYLDIIWGWFYFSWTLALLIPN